MRLLIVSDPPMVPGAYAIQTQQLARWLVGQGHEVLVFGLTYYGSELRIDGIRIVGGAVHTPLQDSALVNHYATLIDADLILTLKDPYVFAGHALKQFSRPWVPVVPMDTEPLNLATKYQLTYAAVPLTLTHTAQRMLEAEGIRALYAPHAIDTDFWVPGDQAEARKALGIPPDVFMAACVGQNNSKPSRKGWDQAVLAWKAFIETVPGMADAVLYLHTSLSTLYGGINLKGLIEAIQLPERNYRVIDQQQYDSGTLASTAVRWVYQAADVLLNPAMGGGFELPCVEAQACGSPVIASDWTAMRETVGAGWRISAGPGTGEPVWCELGGFRLQVTRAAIVEALKQAVARKDDPTLKDAARQHALKYSTATVYDTYWTPVMHDLEALLVAGELTHDEPSVERSDAPAVERAGAGGSVSLCTEPEGPGRVDPGGVSGDGRRELSTVP